MNKEMTRLRTEVAEQRPMKKLYRLVCLAPHFPEKEQTDIKKELLDIIGKNA